MSRQSVLKHKVDALYIVKAMFFNNKSINTQLIPMPIWVTQLSLVGHKEKKTIHENGWNLCDRRRGLVGMREALDRRASDQSASHTCVT